uniref:Linker for activation of T-cells family member 2 n=1 Tax=Chinchilla lanigera TaxID=34839 RepID=A0A8C2VCB1_CHILA
MGAETELLWPGAALLLLLGAVAGLCVRCSRPGKGALRTGEQAPLRAWLGPQMDTAPDASCPSLDVPSRSLPDANPPAYHVSASLARDPIAVDYYNWGCSRKPPEDEDDTNSYENVLICQPRVSLPCGEDSEDYQNSASIHQWHESTRAWGRAPGSPVEDDGEPDYVNGDVAAREA